MKKSFMKFFAASFVIVMLTVFSGCGGDDPVDPPVVPTMSIVEIVDSTPGLDSLSKYLNRYPNLVSLLSGTDEYTLFAPNNEAFIGLLATPGFPSDFDLINPDIIEGVFAYHVTAGSVASSEFVESNTLNTLYTDAATSTLQTIAFNSNGTLLTGSTNNQIEVLDGDVAATNGVVHITGSVLIPPSVGATLTPILGTNAGTILLGADFSILAEGVALADAYAAANSLPTTIAGTLAGSTVHTVFAPTNATFEAAQLTAASFDGGTWYGILLHHVVIQTDGTIVEAAELTNGASFASALGVDLRVFNNPDIVPASNGVGIYFDSNGDVDFTLADGGASLANLDAEVALPNAAENSNGVVHVIAGVLTPPAQ